jgi:predicted Kef-type K+ transport protein
MGTAISLPNGELISLGLTTFLYGTHLITMHLSSRLTTTVFPRIGLFFALFFVTVIMTFYLRESTRQLHIKILPVPFLMLLVATAVREPLTVHSTKYQLCSPL